MLSQQGRFARAFEGTLGERRASLDMRKEEGRLRLRKRPSFVDGDKPNSVRSRQSRDRDDHLSKRHTRGFWSRKGFETGGPAALPLFCLAPHGVFRASRITSRAVSSCLAFSPLPVLQRTGGMFSVTLSVNTRLAPGLPACSTRHAAVWCSDFPLANPSIHQRSSAISPQFITINTEEKRQRLPKGRSPATRNLSQTGIEVSWLAKSTKFKTEPAPPGKTLRSLRRR